MSRDGSGTFSLPQAAFVYNTVISETAVNSNFSDIAAALTASLAKDGQTTPTANLPMGGYKHTGAADGSSASDYAALHQIQDQDGIWCGTSGGPADALTISPTPAITAYGAGQKFRFIAGATNTTATTVAVSGLTTKAIQLNGSALVAGDITSGKLYEIDYDGTQFQITRLSGAFLSDPMTTRGDILYRNSSNATARLALGTAGFVLGSDGTDASWRHLIVTKLITHTSDTALASQASGGSQIGSTLSSLPIPTAGYIRLTILQGEFDTDSNLGRAGFALDVGGTKVWAISDEAGGNPIYSNVLINAGVTSRLIGTGTDGGAASGTKAVVFDIAISSFPTGTRDVKLYMGDMVNSTTGEVTVTGTTVTFYAMVEIGAYL